MTGYNLRNLKESIHKEKEEISDKLTKWEDYVNELIDQRENMGYSSPVELIKAFARRSWHKQHLPLMATDEMLQAELSIGLKESYGKKRIEQVFLWLANNQPDEWACETYTDQETKRKTKLLKPIIKENARESPREDDVAV